ncbi:hypothetical protein AgCh_027806 [Apium graveolens]
MSGDKAQFLSLQMKKGGRVTIGDSKTLQILGKGKIGNKHISIDKVQYVKGLKYNLPSISQLYDDGHNVNFGIDIDPYVWHRRLGHAHMDLLNKLSNKKLVRGLPKIKYVKTEVCSACQLGKQIRSTHKAKKMVSTSKPLELLHLDLFGPEAYKSIGGPNEFTSVYYSLQRWREIFEKNDGDISGKIDASELREALVSLGFVVSPLDLLVSKFDKTGGRNKAIEYDNFIEYESISPVLALLL